MSDYLNNMSFQQQIDFFFPDDVNDFIYSIKIDNDLILDVGAVVNCIGNCECGRTFIPLEPFVNSFKNYYTEYKKLYIIKDFNPYISISLDKCGFCQYEIDKIKIWNQ
jgi:hypothetical protein